MELPNYLKSGDVARLFPVIAETGKEQRAASILLSVLSAVPPFSNSLLSPIGQKIGSRTTVNTFTEIVFQNEDPSIKKNRPDGLIEVSVGRRRWAALLEAKIGNSVLNRDQIERYLRLAKDNSIDAVITVSNEFAALPTHHPISVQKSLTRRVTLYHFSWMSILTSAVLLQERSSVSDPEQAFLLREFIRFFSHSSAGISSFVTMPQEWTAAVQKIQAGGTIPKSSFGREIVKSWHQEVRDLSLRMSRIVGCEITAKLSRAHEKSLDARISDELEKLCSEGSLEALLEVPDAASDIRLVADLRNRTIRVSMTLNAPREKKTNKARLNWLLRQLKGVSADNISVAIIRASRAPDTHFTLNDLRQRPEHVDEAPHKSEVRAFEVILTSASARRFVGRRTFIDELEDLAPRFYEVIGQHLRAWKPTPPKPKHSVTTEPKADVPPEKPNERTSAGNAHSEILEIPDFLKRISDIA